jgi:hypothetical protein
MDICYTYLRHIYLSDIARSGREALLSLGPDNFDSIQMAFMSQSSGDTKDPKDKAEMVSKMCEYLMTSLSRQVDGEQKARSRKGFTKGARRKTESDDGEDS